MINISFWAANPLVVHHCATTTTWQKQKKPTEDSRISWLQTWPFLTWQPCADAMIFHGGNTLCRYQSVFPDRTAPWCMWEKNSFERKNVKMRKPRCFKAIWDDTHKKKQFNNLQNLNKISSEAFCKPMEEISRFHNRPPGFLYFKTVPVPYGFSASDHSHPWFWQKCTASSIRNSGVDGFNWFEKHCHQIVWVKIKKHTWNTTDHLAMYLQNSNFTFRLNPSRICQQQVCCTSFLKPDCESQLEKGMLFYWHRKAWHWPTIGGETRVQSLFGTYALKTTLQGMAMHVIQKSPAGYFQSNVFNRLAAPTRFRSC